MLDVGALPVCEGERCVGMISDRDITVRVIARGRSADTTPVRAAMSYGLVTCSDDQSAAEAADTMADSQVRRLPVVNARGRIVGIVSLSDLAASRIEVPHLPGVIWDVSKPTMQPRGRF